MGSRSFVRSWRIGSRLLRNVEVSAAIATAQAERAERLQVTADVVVAELALHAFGDFRDFFDESRLLEPFELSTETAHRVCSIRITRELTGQNPVRTGFHAFLGQRARNRPTREGGLIRPHRHTPSLAGPSSRLPLTPGRGCSQSQS